MKRSHRGSRTGLVALLWWVGLAVAVAPSYSAEPYIVRALTEPVGDVVLSARVAGQVAEIHFSEGDFVAEGAAVLELEQRTEQLEVQRKQVQLDTLQAELERSEILFKTASSLPREELERKRGEVAIARVELEQAKEMLERRRVVAPFGGVITQLPVKVGEYCDLARPVVRLVDSRSFYAVSNADPTRAGHLRVGQAIEIDVPAGAGSARLVGNVVFVSPVVDPASGLLRVKARFDNPDDRVRPGAAGMLRVPLAHDATP